MKVISEMNTIPNSQLLIPFTLYLADNALILGHRNSEWCGHGPVLEQDIAITNISLDLIGQARNFYQYAAQIINTSQKTGGPNVFPTEGKLADGAAEATEDTLAYLRDPHEFRNCLLVELPNGDWAITILRQFLFSNYQYLLYQHLQNGADQQLAAIAAKSLKEVTYHLRWSSEWVIRLGDGTDESRGRILTAIETLWQYTGELFETAGQEKVLGINVLSLKKEWTKKVTEVFDEATLPVPGEIQQQTGGREGRHSEYLDNLLSEMQFLQRTYPKCEW